MLDKFEANRTKLNLLFDNIGIEMIKEKDINKDFKSMITKVNQKCANSELIKYAIEELSKLKESFARNNL